MTTKNEHIGAKDEYDWRQNKKQGSITGAYTSQHGVKIRSVIIALFN